MMIGITRKKYITFQLSSVLKTTPFYDFGMRVDYTMGWTSQKTSFEFLYVRQSV
jgi:hypothetical protein